MCSKMCTNALFLCTSMANLENISTIHQSQPTSTRYTVHGTSAKAPILGKSAMTTDLQIIHSITFLSCDARHVRNLFFKVRKKLVKKWFQLRWIYKAQSNFDPFWIVFLKSGFQSLTVERHVSTNMPPGEINWRTDGTSDFDHPTDVKSASGNNEKRLK